MRFGVHYGMTAVLHTWHWCCEGLRKLGRGEEALSLGLSGRAAIETALSENPEESDCNLAMKYLLQLGTWLLRQGRPEAEECLQRVLILTEGLPPDLGATLKVHTLCTLAQGHRAKNELCTVLNYAQRAMEVRRAWWLARQARYC
jgi:hypothetical protein